jgi:hypothetical protein
MADVVFILCAATSAVCVALLLRGYRRTRGRLIFWAAVCFAGLALNSLLVVVDEIVVPGVDMWWRTLPATVGLAALLYGMVREQP